MTNAAAGDDERMRQVGQGLASWNLEGAELDPETTADLIAFSLGNLTADEVVRRARVRCGLETSIRDRS